MSLLAGVVVGAAVGMGGPALRNRLVRGRVEALVPERALGRTGPALRRRSATGGRGATRRSRDPAPTARLDAAVLLDLLAAVVAGGSSVPGALVALGEALGGPDGDDLASTGRALQLGASWEAAWSRAPARFAPVRDALGPTWAQGSAPGPALTVAAARVRREREAALAAATARLGVRLVVPLGLCFLPAFVLAGLAPLLASLVGDLLGSGV